MRNSAKRDPALVVQHLHLTIKNMFGQDVAVITVPIEWVRTELEFVLPDGFEFRVPIPPVPGGNPDAVWSVCGKAGTP